MFLYIYIGKRHVFPKDFFAKAQTPLTNRYEIIDI